MKRLICCKICDVTKDGKQFSPILTSDRGLMYFQTCDTCFDTIPTSTLLKAARQQRWRLKQQLKGYQETPNQDDQHLQRLAPWHPDDLRLVKIFIALRRKRNLKIRWERVAQFNRNTHPDYFLEQERWLGVMRQVQQEVDALVLPIYSWETLKPERNLKSERQQRWRLKRKAARSNINDLTVSSTYPLGYPTGGQK